MSDPFDGTTADTAITSLSILKSIAEFSKDDDKACLVRFEASYDTVYYLYQKAIELCADKLYERYVETHDVGILGLMNNNMTEYYQCAYKLGEVKRMPDDLNTYLTKAMLNRKSTIGMISHYTFDYHLYESKRRKPRLMLMCSDEYYPNGEVIYQLCRFFRFFNDNLPGLKAELKSYEDGKEKIKARRQRKVRNAG